jgi:transcription elongation factor Elf1
MPSRPPSFTTFKCPNCDALYQVVKVEAVSGTSDREITCRHCGAPLPRREGKFVVKYFLLRTTGRVQRWRRTKMK